MDGRKFGGSVRLPPTSLKIFEEGMHVGSSEGSSDGNILIESDAKILGSRDGC